MMYVCCLPAWLGTHITVQSPVHLPAAERGQFDKQRHPWTCRLFLPSSSPKAATRNLLIQQCITPSPYLCSSICVSSISFQSTRSATYLLYISLSVCLSVYVCMYVSAICVFSYSTLLHSVLSSSLLF